MNGVEQKWEKRQKTASSFCEFEMKQLQNRYILDKLTTAADIALAQVIDSII
jgi:hypothetical protein